MVGWGWLSRDSWLRGGVLGPWLVRPYKPSEEVKKLINYMINRIDWCRRFTTTRAFVIIKLMGHAAAGRCGMNGDSIWGRGLLFVKRADRLCMCINREGRNCKGFTLHLHVCWATDQPTTLAQTCGRVANGLSAATDRIKSMCIWSLFW